MTERWEWLTGRQGELRSIVAVILTLAIILGFGGACWSQLSEEQSREIEIFEQQKSKAEDFVRLLRKRWEKKKISEESLNKGEALYNDAKAAFNGYITKFQFDIKAGRKPSQETLKDAVEKSQKFNNYAEEQVYGQSRGAVVALVATLVPTLTKAGLDFWKEYRKATQQERDRLAQELDKIKWQPFDQIR